MTNVSNSVATTSARPSPSVQAGDAIASSRIAKRSAKSAAGPFDQLLQALAQLPQVSVPAKSSETPITAGIPTLIPGPSTSGQMTAPEDSGSDPSSSASSDYDTTQGTLIRASATLATSTAQGGLQKTSGSAQSTNTAATPKNSSAVQILQEPISDIQFTLVNQAESSTPATTQTSQAEVPRVTPIPVGSEPPAWLTRSWADSPQAINATSAANVSDVPAAQQSPASQGAAPDNTGVKNASSSSDAAAVLSQLAALKATLTETPRITASAPLISATSLQASGLSSSSLNRSLTAVAELFPRTSTSLSTVAYKTTPGDVSTKNLPQSQEADTAATPNEDSASPQKDAGSQSSNQDGNKSRSENSADNPVVSNVEAASPAQPVAIATIPPAQPSSNAISGVETNSENGTPAAPSQILTHQSGLDSELSGALQAWNGGDNAQARSMQMTNIVKNPGTSEMSISLQADSIGSVQLRARVSSDQVGAAIMVERHDVHAALTSDLPVLHQALAEKQFRVENVSLSQGQIHSGDSGNASGDSSRQAQQRGLNTQHGSSSRWTAENSAASSDSISGFSVPDVNVLFDSNGRLSVRA